MLKFYYATISANSQRVWITLLEKQIPFEPIIVNLDGEQFQSEFTAINPLQQVPAIVDNGLRVFESLAILDYLEAKYPVPELMPKELDTLAIARMISMSGLVGQLLRTPARTDSADRNHSNYSLAEPVCKTIGY